MRISLLSLNPLTIRVSRGGPHIRPWLHRGRYIRHLRVSARSAVRIGRRSDCGFSSPIRLWVRLLCIADILCFIPRIVVRSPNDSNIAIIMLWPRVKPRRRRFVDVHPRRWRARDGYWLGAGKEGLAFDISGVSRWCDCARRSVGSRLEFDGMIVGI